MKQPSPEKAESSVVFSLAELTKLQQERIDEAARDEAARVEAERVAAAKKKDEEAKRRADDEERRARAEAMRRVDEAQIEAAKNAEIERRAMEQRHRHELARLQAENAHAREMAQLAETRRPRVVSASLVAGILAVVAVLVVGALLWTISVVPKRQTDAIQALSQKEQDIAAEHATADAAHQKKLDDMQIELDRLKEQVKNAMTKTALTADPKPKPPVSVTHVVPTSTSTASSGCDVDVPGVPMCAKKAK